MLPCFGKLSNFAHGFFHVFFKCGTYWVFSTKRTNKHVSWFIYFLNGGKNLLYNLVFFLNSYNNYILLVWWTLNKSFYKLEPYDCHSSINNHWVLLSTCTQQVFIVTWKSRDLKPINSPALWKAKLQHICNIVECLLNMNRNYLFSNIIIHGVVESP